MQEHINIRKYIKYIRMVIYEAEVVEFNGLHFLNNNKNNKIVLHRPVLIMCHEDLLLFF